MNHEPRRFLAIGHAEGTEVRLIVADEEDELDDEERARLHESLRRSMAQARAGQLIDADEVIGKLLSRGG